MAPSSSKYFSLYFTQNSIIVFTFIINSITSRSFWILRPSLWNWICYFRGKKSSIEAVHTTLVIDDENPTRLNTVQLLPTLWTKPAEFFRVKKKIAASNHEFQSRLLRRWFSYSWSVQLSSNFPFFHLLQLISLLIKNTGTCINKLFFRAILLNTLLHM